MLFKDTENKYKMSNLICEYCKKSYSNKSSLNNHQKTTKKCLEIQKKLSSSITNIIEVSNLNEISTKYTCKYCSKNFTTKQNIKNHQDICLLKKDYEISELKKYIEFELLEIKEKHKFEILEIKGNYNMEIEELKDKYDFETTELKLLNKKYLEEIQQLRETIAGLQGEMRIMSKSNDCVYEIAKQPKNNITHNNSTNSNTTTNNSTNKTLNITSSLNFKDIDKVKEIIQQKYDITHILGGQKGCAQFAVQHLLLDSNGKFAYICTDPSRNSFKFKNEDGIIEKDLEPKKLTNYLVDGGLYEKAKHLALDWCHNDGVVDQDKFLLVSEKQVGIMNMKENNSEFKKELSSLVS